MPRNPRFFEPNVSSRPKRKEIPDAIWERHKDTIMSEYGKGLSKEKIARWIENKQISGFKPR
jgi:hypothetical protein